RWLKFSPRNQWDQGVGAHRASPFVVSAPILLPAHRVNAALSSAAVAGAPRSSRYCTLVYAQTKSYQDAARRLGIDRRTARATVDQAWLGEIGGTERRRCGG